MDKFIAFVVLSILVSVGVYFFNKEKLSNTGFISFTLGLLFLFISFYSIDRLKEFNITGMKLVLSEMKDTKSDFDKRVNTLLEILAELNVDYTVSQGLWIDAPIPDKLIKARATSEKMLSLAGKTDDEITQLTNAIDKVIIGKYFGSLIREIDKESGLFKDLAGNDIKAQRRAFVEDLSAYNYGQNTNLNEVVKFLKSNGVEQKIFKAYISDIEFYIKKHLIKKPSLIGK